MTDKQKMDKILNDLQSDKRVQQMKDYKQHGRINTFDHCDSVARLSYRLNKLHLHADVPTLIKELCSMISICTTGITRTTASTDCTVTIMRRRRERTPKVL